MGGEEHVSLVGVRSVVRRAMSSKLLFFLMLSAPMCGENAQYQHENSQTCFKKNLAGEIMWRNETDFVLE